ncbi:MAG: O-antigen ligase family protein [Candidatus Sumerlaeia bacterium]|nr:O-antigen ligase family protein [Candidatus Sumerlaeia bacterium]
MFLPLFWNHPFSAVSLLTFFPALLCLAITMRNTAHGLMLLAFLIPLMGNLPHLSLMPCPPPLLLVIGAFALAAGVLNRRAAGNEQRPAVGARPEAVAVLSMAGLLAVSGMLTAWRYLEFAPLGGMPAWASPVNLRQDSALDAVAGVWQMTVLMLSGPLLFLLVRMGWCKEAAANTSPTGEAAHLGRGNPIGKGNDIPPFLRWLLTGSFLAFLLGIAQMAFFPAFGNDPFWAQLRRINATFTDPNALGTYMVLLLPLALAVALASARRSDRVLGAATAAFGLTVLAGSGSRTGAAGLIAAGVLFPVVAALRFPAADEVFRRRATVGSLAALIAAIAFLPLDFRAGREQWTLVERLARTRDVVVRHGPAALLLRDRWPLWEPALHIAKLYPVGGIGLGAFHFEVGNVARLEGRHWPAFDNANNQYLQLAAELGAAGLALWLLVFGLVAYAIIRAVRSPAAAGPLSAVSLAIATAWFAFLIVFITGPHLLFEQVQAVFWLYAALPVWIGCAGREKETTTCPPTRRWGGFAAWPAVPGLAAVVVVTIAQVKEGSGDLSLRHRRPALGLLPAEGFYGRESDETGRRFRWTGEQARQSVPTARGELRIELRAGHPDLARQPLVVWFTLAGKTAHRCELSTDTWQWVRVPVPAQTPNPAELHIRVERTWRPSDLGIFRDTRRLGVAIARIENADPGDPLPP